MRPQIVHKSYAIRGDEIILFAGGVAVDGPQSPFYIVDLFDLTGVIALAFCLPVYAFHGLIRIPRRWFTPNCCPGCCRYLISDSGTATTRATMAIRTAIQRRG